MAPFLSIHSSSVLFLPFLSVLPHLPVSPATTETTGAPESYRWAEDSRSPSTVWFGASGAGAAGAPGAAAEAAPSPLLSPLCWGRGSPRPGAIRFCLISVCFWPLSVRRGPLLPPSHLGGHFSWLHVGKTDLFFFFVFLASPPDHVGIVFLVNVVLLLLLLIKGKRNFCLREIFT